MYVNIYIVGMGKNRQERKRGRGWILKKWITTNYHELQWMIMNYIKLPYQLIKHCPPASSREHADPVRTCPQRVLLDEKMQTTSKINNHAWTNEFQFQALKPVNHHLNWLHTCILGIFYVMLMLEEKMFAAIWPRLNLEYKLAGVIKFKPRFQISRMCWLTPSGIGDSASVELSCTALKTVWQVRCWLAHDHCNHDWRFWIKPISGSKDIVNVCIVAWKCETQFLCCGYRNVFGIHDNVSLLGEGDRASRHTYIFFSMQNESTSHCGRTGLKLRHVGKVNIQTYILWRCIGGTRVRTYDYDALLHEEEKELNSQHDD